MQQADLQGLGFSIDQIAFLLKRNVGKGQVTDGIFHNDGGVGRHECIDALRKRASELFKIGNFFHFMVGRTEVDVGQLVFTLRDAFQRVVAGGDALVKFEFPSVPSPLFQFDIPDEQGRCKTIGGALSCLLCHDGIADFQRVRAPFLFLRPALVEK